MAGRVRVGMIADPVLSRPWYVEDLGRPEGQQWSFHATWTQAMGAAVAQLADRRAEVAS